MVAVPDDLRYRATDEWVTVETAPARVGLSAPAVVELGDVAYVDLPAVGVELAAGEPFGVVESAKAVSELYAPVTGRVTAVNETLATAPRTLNEDPYGAGWLLEVTPTDEYPADLLDAATYRAHVDG